MKRVALITGITGQDGAYLAQFLLDKGYDVHGVIRPSSTPNTGRLHLLLGPYFAEIKLHYGDMTDAQSLVRIVQQVRPDEIYNLAAQSHVHTSFHMPQFTAQVDGLGALHLLEAVRLGGMEKNVRYYQASTSELFGKAVEIPQNETTPFYPRSPYGAAKLYAYWMTKNYREAYGLHASNGILFNHESPLRGEHFVSRKITKAVVAIQKGTQQKLALGNLDALRDWGHARDYVEGMWLMTQQEQGDDYILATGQAQSVREFVELSFSCVDIDLRWVGSGAEEKGYDQKTGQILVEIDPALYRPAEVDILQGDATKAREKLGWAPQTTFQDLVTQMIEAELNSIYLNV